MIKIDLTNKTFGELTVLQFSTRDKAGRAVWSCRCSCGVSCSVRGDHLASGRVRSCGHLVGKKHPKNLVGFRVGRLLVVSKTNKHKENVNGFLWECLCDCGKTVFVDRGSLTSEHQRSCGCLLLESYHWSKNKTHGMSKTNVYLVWQAMLNRCYRENSKSYNRYGARGIRVCSKWRSSFETFYKWLLFKNYVQGLTIERLDYNGDYEPENCTLIPGVEQAKNRRPMGLVPIDTFARRLLNTRGINTVEV